MTSSTAVHDGPVHGFLTLPPGKPAGGLVLTHGAGGNCVMPLLAHAAEAFAATGYCVLRCDLPFRQKRPTGPPRPAEAADDRAGLKAAVEWMRAQAPGPVAMGGQSYGGRQATMLAAAEPSLVSALLLFSYPLHPPGKPESPRTAHFLSLHVPALFVSGTKDPFGSPEELRDAIKLIPARTALRLIDGAGHDLKRGKFDFAAEVVAPFQELAGVRS